MRVLGATSAPLLVPLREPFTIATARMDTTRAALVRLVGRGLSSTDQVAGLGEAACLYPVTREDLPDVLAAAENALPRLVGVDVSRPEDCADLAARAAEGFPVLVAAIECALVDALARSRGQSVARLFGVDDRMRTHALESDITIPIAEESEMLRVGRTWHEAGFRAFKAKVGRAQDVETRSLCTMHTVLPGLRFRLDANAGFSAEDALTMLGELRRHGAHVECFEQPCARDDWDGMAKVVRDGRVDVVADESLRGWDDLERLVKTRAATSVNLKLVKLGGFGPSLALGREATRLGLGLMVGGMVETRLGMTCAATLASCLPKVAYADLDTAWLLAEDPFDGGFTSEGPHIRVIEGFGFSVRERG